MNQAQQQPPDVAVIGGGVIGLAVAWEVVRRGLSVVVLERERPGRGTTHVAAGMLAPVSEATFGEEALTELNLASAAMYPRWVQELARAAGGADTGYLPCGSLLVARDRDQAEALERELAFREEQGLAVRRLTPTEARRREPGLAPVVRLAAEAPDDHAVDPRRLVVALLAALRGAGATVRCDAPVAGLVTRGDRVVGAALSDGEQFDAGCVVVAAGCWAGDLNGLPPEARLPLRPVKGQLMVLRDLAGPGLLGSVLRSEDAYLVPRGDGRYVLGATVEERGFDTTVTAGAAFELLREAIDLVPGVAELEVEESLAGLRPNTPDNAPAIGHGALEGLVWATGHYRHGVLLAPITASAVADVLAGEPASPVVAPFTPARFAVGVTA